jgi:hypothetical protein
MPTWRGGPGSSRVRSRALVAISLVVSVALGWGLTAAAAAPPTWSVVPTPSPGASLIGGLSCVDASTCVMVGNQEPDVEELTLAEHWNGATWSIVASPSRAEDNQLSAVSCVRATRCDAVGWSGTHGMDQSLIEQWNGTKWSIVSSPNPGDNGSALTGISCTSASACVASGRTSNATTPSVPLIETFDGAKWSVSPLPTMPGDSAAFDGVTCATATDCTAVGEYFVDDGYQPLVVHFDGTSWSVASTPTIDAKYARLSGVSCVSAKSCVAVGFSEVVPVKESLVEQWDGTSWKVVASPSPGSPYPQSVLRSVTCLTARRCVAVGGAMKGSNNHSLIERWNGTHWKVSKSPSPGTEDNGLTGVWCGSASKCIAAGSSDRQPFVLSTLPAGGR